MKKVTGLGRIWTADPWIISPTLYQLRHKSRRKSGQKYLGSFFPCKITLLPSCELISKFLLFCEENVIAQGSHFKTPRSSAQFQDTKCEGRSNKTQNHFDLLGNWTPVIYMTVNNLTTIPLSTAWYAWRLFWSVEGQAPELVKWSNPKGQILRSDENANVLDFGYQFDRQTHLPHVNFLIDSEGLHKISKIFVGLNAFCSINKYDIFFQKSLLEPVAHW